MKRNPLLLFCAGTALVLASCVSHRLDGPVHSAEGPPWIADGAQVPVADLDVEHRVVLIGDAGLFLEDDPVLASLRRWTETGPAATVLFLGDNIYNDGLQSDDRERGEQILGQQLEAAAGRKIVVPGNHDWGMNPKKAEVEPVLNQQEFVDEWPGGEAEFLPKSGCMGPEVRELAAPARGGRAVVAVLVDPTPWLNPLLAPACPAPMTHDEFLAALDAVLAEHADDWVVMASHYPLLTGGPHGGLSYGALADPIVAVLAWRYGGLGNTYEPTYADWIARTSEVMGRHAPAVYAAGHDHSLQILEGRGVVGAHVVSGAGAVERVSTVTHLDETVFAHARAGFVVVDFGRRGGRPTGVLRVVEEGRDEPVFTWELP